jgi:penicillin-insensitive murein endopeptidase
MRPVALRLTVLGCAGLVVSGAGFVSGCAGPGLLTDGTSVSLGGTNRGVLRDAARLPFIGEGYTVPPTWRQRRSNYGTDELVGVVVQAARRVSREAPGAVLGVADLSRKGGGESPEHRSHHSGRDADLHFYSTDPSGTPLPPPRLRMEPYGANGMGLGTETIPPEDETATLGPQRVFDKQRNWLLVRALVENRAAEVQWIFISTVLERKLLAYAQAANEPPAVIAHASQVMHQPLDSARHNDHIHVRIYCPPGDRALGCRDRAPARWRKKRMKYDGRLRYATRSRVPAALQRLWVGMPIPLPF